MRLSELAARSGLSIATVKYYLRIGLVPGGKPVSATEAQYADRHLERLRLIRALREVVRLPIERIREVLVAVDLPGESMYDRFGRAIAALSPTPEPDSGAGGEPWPRARRAIEVMGLVYDPDFPAVGQLDAALAAAESVGVPVGEGRLRRYAEHLLVLAKHDLEQVPDDRSAAIGYAVLGTALHEPVVLAIRRLAHQTLAADRWAADPGPKTAVGPAADE